MDKIFGIGWAKTGTTTLGECFRLLGFDHQTQRLDLVSDVARGDLTRLIDLAKQKDTFEDWPWLILYRELDEAFPGSRFILTQRDPDQWIQSYQNMLRNQGEASEEMNEIRRTLYGLPFPNVTKEQLIARYVQHNTEVAGYFKSRPQSLLTVNWGAGDGWTELCHFLGCEVPAVPFPHANQGVYRGANQGIIAKLGPLLKRSRGLSSASPES